MSYYTILIVFIVSLVLVNIVLHCRVHIRQLGRKYSEIRFKHQYDVTYKHQKGAKQK